MVELVSQEDREAIEHAQFIVGQNPAGNSSLRAGDLTELHIGALRCFGDEATPLIERLSTGPVRDAFERQDRYEQQAMSAQKSYNRLKKAVATPLTIALVLSLVLVVVRVDPLAEFLATIFTGELSGGEALATFQVGLRQGMPWLVYFLFLGTPLLALLLRPDEQYRKWQVARGTAEALRREIFRRILMTNRNSEKDMTPWSLLLRLEFFRRWQVEVQHQYFLRRPGDHRRAMDRAALARKTFCGGAIVLGVFLFLSSTASLDEQGPSVMPSGFSRLAFLETWGADYFLMIFSSLMLLAAGYLYYQVTLANSVRNSARFINVQGNFDALLEPELMMVDGKPMASPLKVAREGAAMGNPEALLDYMNEVHSIMSIELNDWVRLAELDQGKDTFDYRQDASPRS